MNIEVYLVNIFKNNGFRMLYFRQQLFYFRFIQSCFRKQIKINWPPVSYLQGNSRASHQIKALSKAADEWKQLFLPGR